MAEQNYFTCTLEHAENRRRQGLGRAPWETLLQLVEEQAEIIPNSEAIGFVSSELDESNCEGNTYNVFIILR